jgi:hypothetical protein
MLFVSAIRKDEMDVVCGSCGRENLRAPYFGGKIKGKWPL